MEFSNAIDTLASEDYVMDVALIGGGYMAPELVRYGVEDQMGRSLPNEAYGATVAVSGAVYGRYVDDADEVVYPERFGAAGAKTALLGGNFNAIGELTEGLQLLTVRLPEGSPVVGEQVNAIDLGDRGRIYAHGRDGEPLTIPLPGTLLEAEDRLALIARSDAITEVRSELLGE